MFKKMLAALVLPLLVLMGCSAPVAEPVDMTGTWTSVGDTPSQFEADISTDEIVVEIVSDGAKMLYWKGTFDHSQSPTFTSVADKEALNGSLLGSTADDKEFAYSNGELSFEFTVMGTTTTVRMQQSS